MIGTCAISITPFTRQPSLQRFFSGKEKQLELHFLGDQPDFLEDVDTRKLLQKSRQSRKNAFNLNSGLFAKKKSTKKISPKIF